LKLRAQLQDLLPRPRSLLISFGVALLLVVVCTTAIVIAKVSASSAPLADRIGEAGDILAGGTLLLAAIAAVVALLAYAVTTGLPRLRLKVLFEFSEPNQPAFQATVNEQGWVKADSFEQTMCMITIGNLSGYFSARNPAVVVRLNGMALQTNEVSPSREWVIIEHTNPVGVTAVQWDGGSASIHGRSSRQLPMLDLEDLCHIPEWGMPSIRFELLAEGGYQRWITIPVDFKVDGQSKFPRQKREKLPAWI
jgi:hypothetical protein